MNAYCKIVIRHAAISAIRRLQRKRGLEISLEYLMCEKHYPITDWHDFVIQALIGSLFKFRLELPDESKTE